MGSWIKAKIVNKKQWTDELFSLQFEADMPSFNAGQFVRIALDIDGERVARPYSCVNSPTESLVEVYFNIVPQGPLTNELVNLEPGDLLWVWDKINGFLTLDEVPKARHLWLCATGTGVGPFISMLKTKQLWERFEKIVLVHGVRKAEDLSYRDFALDRVAEFNQQLIYLPVVSREQTDFALHGRMSTLLENGELEQRAGVKLSALDSHIMLCGNSQMIKDVSELLNKRDMRRHKRREPGHITTEKYH